MMTAPENCNFSKTFLTIFTPTYNRAHTLPELYESLLAQSDKDFQWLIIDDGSTDNTADLVKSWINENRIRIKYYFQENGGKHMAYNHALEVADSELFCPIDSDDLVVYNCVERIKYHWNFSDQIKRRLGAISFLLSKTDGGKWNEDFKSDSIESRFPELVYSKIIESDIGFVFDLKKIKSFRYPETWRRIYVPDAIVPYFVSTEYSILFINERLGIYRWNPADFDRLSNFSRPEKLKSGGAASLFLQYWIYLNFGKKYIMRYPRRHFYFAMQFHRFGKLAGLGLFKRMMWIKPFSVKLFCIPAILPGLLLASITELKYRKYINKK